MSNQIPFLLCFSLVPSLTHGLLDFYIGYGDQNDNVVKQHHMYNRSIGIYHRRQSESLKFCFDKPAGHYSMGSCKNFFAECDRKKNLAIVMCPVGELYRGEEDRCVPESMEARCYHVQYADNDQECQRSDHQEMISLGDCENQYAVCFGGSAYFLGCPHENEAFSDTYGACLPKHEHPKCRLDHQSHSYSHARSNSDSSEEDHHVHPVMQVWPLSTMCRADSKTDYSVYLGGCNPKYMFCGHDGFDFLVQCEKGTVADGSVGECVPISESTTCPANWDDAHEDVAFVDHMNAILKSIDYCKGKQNGLYFDPYSECRREAIVCVKGDPNFQLCPRSFGIDEKGWCTYKEVCSNQNQDPQQWRSYFLALFAADAHLCQKTEIDGIHVFGLCQNFYGRCRRGRFEIEKCENADEIFDSLIGGCRVPTGEDHCDKLDTPKPINRCMSSDPDEVRKLKATGKCEESFLVCINGWETIFKCEKKDYVFDQQSEHCMPKAAHPDCPEFRPDNSSSSTSSTSESTEKVHHVPHQPLTCHGDGGFHEHEQACAKFYRCAHGRMVEMSCPEGTAFDSTINVCNHKHLVARCSDYDA